MTNFTPDLLKRQRILLPAGLLACSLLLPFSADGANESPIPVTHQVRTKIQVSGNVADQLGPLPGATIPHNRATRRNPSSKSSTTATRVCPKPWPIPAGSLSTQ